VDVAGDLGAALGKGVEDLNRVSNQAASEATAVVSVILRRISALCFSALAVQL
jgi:hypothetical protein